jgi:hypothetical protein
VRMRKLGVRGHDQPVSLSSIGPSGGGGASSDGGIREVEEQSSGWHSWVSMNIFNIDVTAWR